MKEIKRKMGLMEDTDLIQPGFSIDCVIFCFQDGKLRVLLHKFHKFDKMMLPGGFVFRDEDADEAAHRILYQRTGLQNIYLSQLNLFGEVHRTSADENMKVIMAAGLPQKSVDWLLQRFITMSYYSLIKCSDIQLFANSEVETIDWYSIDNLPPIYADHGKIIEKAIERMRINLGHIPVGYELLPKKFTMPELRLIYESILGKELDRRNFQRKMLASGLVIKLNESRKCGAHRSPILYSFNVEKYEEAKRLGIQYMDWKNI